MKDEDKKLVSKQGPLPQLALFEIENLGSNFSNTIDLYDAIPKTKWGTRNVYLNSSETQPQPISEVQTTKIRVRSPHQKEANDYSVEIMPATFLTKDKNGITQSVTRYVSRKDELVEDVLRYFATRGQATYDNTQGAGVTFTIYMIRQRLSELGHSMSHQEIVDSLETLSGSSMSIRATSGNDTLSVKGTILSSLMLRTRKDYELGENLKCYATFHPLVTQGINNQNYRLFNLARNSSIRNDLAGQLHRRMSMYWIQAAKDSPYTFRMMQTLTSLRDQLLSTFVANSRAMRNALKSLVEANVITHYDEEVMVDELDRRKRVDIKFTLYPSDQFIKEAKLANYQAKAIRDKADALNVGSKAQREQIEEIKKLNVKKRASTAKSPKEPKPTKTPSAKKPRKPKIEVDPNVEKPTPTRTKAKKEASPALSDDNSDVIF